MALMRKKVKRKKVQRPEVAPLTAKNIKKLYGSGKKAFKTTKKLIGKGKAIVQVSSGGTKGVVEKLRPKKSVYDMKVSDKNLQRFIDGK
jgi:hypothetical protein